MSEAESKTTDIEASVDRSEAVAGLGMWLFISTEVMLFAALIATYLILRLDTIKSGWPAPSLVHVSPTMGILNTLLLVFSSLTAWHAVQCARVQDKPHSAKLWLIATLLLGSGFLVVKGFEYSTKYRHGLMPVPGQKQIFNQPDYQYLTAVNARLNQELREMEEQASKLGPTQSPEFRDRLALLYELKTYFTGRTAETVGRINNSYHRQLAIRLLAYQIYPHPDTSHGLDAIVDIETEQLRGTKTAMEARRARILERQPVVQGQLDELQETLRGVELIGSTAGMSKEELEQKKDWYAVKQQQALDLEAGLAAIKRQLEPIEGRLNCLVKLLNMRDGLNAAVPLRLPVVVTSGNQWLNAYLLLTGAHALHVLGGLIAFLFFVPRKLDYRMGGKLRLAGMYWQFVDMVWLSIFFLIYF